MPLDPDDPRVLRFIDSLNIVEAGHNPLGDHLLTIEGLDNMPEPDWLIDRIIPRGALAVMFGKPGAFKSFAALDWMLCVASGTNWAGRTVRQGPAIYIAAEGIAGTPWRVKAWQQERNQHSIKEAYWLPCSVNLLRAGEVDNLVDLCETYRPAIVVIDTLARCLVGGDENSAEDVGLAMNAAERLNALGITVIIIHHTTKDGENYRGSSSMEGAAATIIRVEHEGSGAVKFTCMKQKDDLPFESLTLQAVPVLKSVVLSSVVQVGSLSDAERRLLNTLHQDFDDECVHGGRWEENSGIHGTSFDRARKVLVSKGFVERIGSKRPYQYRLTDEGRTTCTIQTPDTFGAWT